MSLILEPQRGYRSQGFSVQRHGSRFAFFKWGGVRGGGLAWGLGLGIWDLGFGVWGLVHARHHGTSGFVPSLHTHVCGVCMCVLHVHARTHARYTTPYTTIPRMRRKTRTYI